jgi:hypothetical protein
MGLICRPQTALPSRTVVRATGEATRLVPGRGFTVAGQCRIPTGLRCTPSHPSSRARAHVLYHWASTGATNGAAGNAVYRSRALVGPDRELRVQLGQRMELVEWIRPEVLGLVNVIAFARGDHE